MAFEIPEGENFKWDPTRKCLTAILADLKKIKQYMDDHLYKNPNLRFALQNGAASIEGAAEHVNHVIATHREMVKVGENLK